MRTEDDEFCQDGREVTDGGKYFAKGEFTDVFDLPGGADIDMPALEMLMDQLTVYDYFIHNSSSMDGRRELHGK